MPRIWLAIVLSLLVHVAAILKLPQFRLTPSENIERGDTRGPMIVQIAPRPDAESAPPVPAPAPAVEPERVPLRAAPSPKQPPRRRAPPPVMVLERQTPEPSPPPPRRAPPPTAQPSARAPDEADLSSYIEARRRTRGDTAPAATAAASAPSAPATEDENTRANRIAAANLGLDRKPAFGAAPQPGGGVFGIQRMTSDYAEFVFYGWNKDIRRNTTQVIEVRKGGNSDIRIAVVRRMIVVIREHEQGDFVWESVRLGRNVSLSARARDNSGLEEFMMREFFGDDRRPLPR